jgi:prevent-host-death family protein
MKINIHEAKTNFSKLIEKAEAGEEIIIARSGKPVAKLVGLGPEKVYRTPGSAKNSGLIVSDDFDDPLPEDILRDFLS